MSDKNIKIALVLSAMDKNMNAIINSSVNKSIGKLQELKKYSDKIADKSFGLSKKSAAIGAGLAAPIVFAMNKVIEFEDKMADVAKVFNTKVGSTEFKALGEEAKDISEYLGTGATAGAALMASLGQGGVEKGILKQVSIDAGEVAVAFDIASDAAGDYYTKMHNAMNLNWNQTKQVADAINYLSDNQASKAKDLLEYMGSGGAGVARASKMLGEESAAFGSYLVSVGKSAPEAATIMERFYKGIMKNESSRSTFLANGQGADGFLAVLQKGANIKNPTDQFKYFSKFGEYGSDIRLMANNLKQVAASVNSVADSESYAGSVHKEFENRNSTAKGQMNRLFASMERSLLDFGENGLPVLTEFLKTMGPIVRGISNWVKSHKELSLTIIKVTAGAAILSTVISAGAAIFGVGAKAMSIFGISGINVLKIFRSPILRWIPGLFKQIGAGIARMSLLLLTRGIPAMASFAATLWANPATWIILGIVAAVSVLVAIGYVLYKNWDKILIWFSDQWIIMKAQVSGMISVFKLLGDVLIGVGKAFIGAFTFNPNLMIEGAKQVASAVSKIAHGGIGKAYSDGFNATLKANSVKMGKDGGLIHGAKPSIKPKSNPVNNHYVTQNFNLTGTKSDGKMLGDELKMAMDKWYKNKQNHERMISYQQ